jgi:hypothetical protein
VRCDARRVVAVCNVTIRRGWDLHLACDAGNQVTRSTRGSVCAEGAIKVYLWVKQGQNLCTWPFYLIQHEHTPRFSFPMWVSGHPFLFLRQCNECEVLGGMCNFGIVDGDGILADPCDAACFRLKHARLDSHGLADLEWGGGRRAGSLVDFSPGCLLQLRKLNIIFVSH